MYCLCVRQGSLFEGEILQYPVLRIMQSKAGDRGHGFSLKDDISKEIPLKPGSGLIFKGLRPEVMAEYTVINRKESIKPLKIRPPAIKPIDIVLRRSAVTLGFCRHTFFNVTYIFSPLKRDAFPYP